MENTDVLWALAISIRRTAKIKRYKLKGFPYEDL